MEISLMSPEENTIASVVHESADMPVLTMSESANIMRTMLSSIDLEELTNDYFLILSEKLPCTSLKLSFADQVLRTGKSKLRSRIMKISIYYGHPFGTPQHAQLAYSFSKVLTPVQRKLLSEIHGIFAMSLRHALEYYRISQLATKDMLTGLGNRASYNESVSKLISMCNRNHESFGLLVFDLDNFKSVNDKYGHQEGDHVLTEFAKLLIKGLRDTDHAFRFGGDEFCCLLTDSSPSANTMVAQRITQSVNNHTLFKEHAVSCSVGATSFLIKDTPQSIFERADTALYKAKHTGKNNIIAA
ncbi:GGDEF domain-containing protein [Agaribacter marinus]|uniref:diguanylate cyclase n=1 Tax=Agaribacter marinus TaxID=1431249 RepID=A0AA37WK04_9ALTE|nr:GGDEF domain-containing protein [Agaribacter marinus]GLR70819.1 diguanylate cyclase [Agaribacter marinus]